MSEKEQLVNFLSQFITPARKELFDKIVKDRTKYITLLLENIYQPHNASAVLRTADCFGLQDIHIVENDNEYEVNPDVALGSSKWVNLHRYNEKANNTLDAILALKKQGYRIVATTPHTNDVDLEEFDISKGKFALLFGSELPGLSKIALDNADEFVKIPMYGFTESFNISVSAAITFHHLVWKLHNSDIKWQPNKQEIQEIKLNWLRQTIKKVDLLEKEFYTKMEKK